ncbi:hypothetical protein FP2506_03309 [Fulvimarina pelagi HTCC2506]|uniref:Uncharacterized protein n=2 Tax=Fulvimarina pelagi TaxID=217511 RepID=Q0G071_9HYPH|nr:hypothetical protein [Fulvimarina pelagi]EAU40722.1 hypothetical protein FP2506_03309 [Fulvimarina pelagi HTCC2506]BAT31264.1 hypothetical protein [Fulvimarina pelagi]
MRWPLILSCILGSAAAAFAAGPQAFGKIALVTGFPDLAARLVDDPQIDGIARFEAGDYQAADEAFAASGKEATYNRGMSLAALGDYALSVAYFDAVLFVDPTDEDARFNRDLVAARVADVVSESNEIDGVAATVETEESEAQATERDILESQPVLAQRSILDPRVERMTAATEGWLETLPDEPAVYLARRIRAENERRQDLGLANPPEDNAW